MDYVVIEVIPKEKYIEHSLWWVRPENPDEMDMVIHCDHCANRGRRGKLNVLYCFIFYLLAQDYFPLAKII